MTSIKLSANAYFAYGKSIKYLWNLWKNVINIFGFSNKSWNNLHSNLIFNTILQYLFSAYHQSHHFMTPEVVYHHPIEFGHFSLNILNRFCGYLDFLDCNCNTKNSKQWGPWPWKILEAQETTLYPSPFCFLRVSGWSILWQETSFTSLPSQLSYPSSKWI